MSECDINGKKNRSFVLLNIVKTQQDKQWWTFLRSWFLLSFQKPSGKVFIAWEHKIKQWREGAWCCLPAMGSELFSTTKNGMACCDDCWNSWFLKKSRCIDCWKTYQQLVTTMFRGSFWLSEAGDLFQHLACWDLSQETPGNGVAVHVLPPHVSFEIFHRAKW